jgi:Domain of unknown function (DUF5134)
VSGPIWLRCLLAVAGLALAGVRLAHPLGPRSDFLAVAGVAMPLGMAAMVSPVGDPARMRAAALALGALTAGLAIAARWREVGATRGDAVDDRLAVALSGAAMVLAAVAGHGAHAPVELAAAVPPLSYPCIRTAVRSIRRARPGSLLRDGGDLAVSAGMISMLVTML